MKTLIIALVLLSMAPAVLAQSRYDTYIPRREIPRPYTSEPSPWPTQPTPYPPGYFTVTPMQPAIPSGPTTGYPGLRGYDERNGIWVPSPYTNSW